MKVIKKTRIIKGGTERHFVDVGEIVEVLEPADEDGMVRIETDQGIVGEVSQLILGGEIRAVL